MKRLFSSLAVGSATTLISVALTPSLPGCRAMRFDPLAFVEQNACNIFNCDTLFFIEGFFSGDHDLTNGADTEGEEEHQH